MVYNYAGRSLNVPAMFFMSLHDIVERELPHDDIPIPASGSGVTKVRLVTARQQDSRFDTQRNSIDGLKVSNSLGKRN